VQTAAGWSVPETQHSFATLLSFTSHSKPKLRKAGHHSVVSAVRGSAPELTPHPTAGLDASHCPAVIAAAIPADNSILYMLVMLRDVLRAEGRHQRSLRNGAETAHSRRWRRGRWARWWRGLATSTAPPGPRSSPCCGLLLLDFMYQGEVSIGQDRLATFLAVAEDLQVKGLTNSTGRLAGPRTSHLLTPHFTPHFTPRLAPHKQFSSSSTIVFQPRGGCFKKAGPPCRMIFWVILSLILAAELAPILHLCSITPPH